MTRVKPCAKCPRCGPTILIRAMPLLDGTPVLMCCTCHRLDTESTWKERKTND